VQFAISTTNFRHVLCDVCEEVDLTLSVTVYSETGLLSVVPGTVVVSCRR